MQLLVLPGDNIFYPFRKRHREMGVLQPNQFWMIAKLGGIPNR